MKLEKDIKQSRLFESPYQKATVNLMYTHNWLINEMKSFFDEYEITMKQFNILRILKGARKSVSTSYVKERMLDKNSDVSRIVDRMSEKNLINKCVSPKDKRLVDLSLSVVGDKLLLKINKNLIKMDKVFSNLNSKEVETLNILLDKIRP